MLRSGSIVCFIFSVGAFVFAMSLDESESDLYISNNSLVDFGEISPNVSRSAKLEIRNLSGRTIRIVAVEPSCSCTKLEIGSRVLESDCGTTLSFRFTSGALVGPALVRCKVFYRLDGDAHLRQKDVSVKAKVVSTFRVSPDRITFRRPKQGEASEQSEILHISPIGPDQRIEIERVECSHRWFSARVAPTDLGHSKQVEVTWHPQDQYADRANSSLRVFLSQPDGLLEVPVQVEE